MQLEHDDLGTALTSYAHANENQERTVVRTATPGECVANVLLYSRGTDSAPVPVTVTLWDLRSEDRIVFTDRRTLTRKGEERTAFRFTIDLAGNASGISHLPASLVSRTRSYTG